MIKRIAFAVCIAAAPILAFGQNDVGIWLNTTQLSTTRITGLGGLEFNRKAGYRITFNHFANRSVSTELGFSQVRGSANVHFPTIGPGADLVALDAGAFRANIASAVVQWHLDTHSAISPYVGVGAAYINGAKMTTTNVPEPLQIADTTYHFADKFTYIANAGVNFAVSRNASIGLDGRYTPYKPTGPLGSLEFNPLTIAVGARFRM